MARSPTASTGDFVIRHTGIFTEGPADLAHGLRGDPFPVFFDNPNVRHLTPRGDKSSYTDKQKRMAAHIEEGYEDRGLSKDEAERRAWATVNKETGGGKKSGSGRKNAAKHATGTGRKKAAAKKRTKG